ncbi:hypothetical protein FRB97_001298 [Tulasnella sp. 331]|nr:hypothetical protein FRB97_001298 [Tulasnella sp. 331]KAG8869675.1 hypothetical protein FRB98_002287 [Tulasnella sp. 332]
MPLSIAIHLLISFLLSTVAAQTADTPPTTTSANGNTYTFEFFAGLLSTDQSIWSSGAPFPESIWNIDVSFVEKPVQYSSLYITVPTAGKVLDLVTTGPEAAYPEFDIEYSYRDAGSGNGAKIENLVLEFVQETTPPTGYYRSAGAFQANPTAQSMNYPYSSDTLDSPGLWYICANYTPTGGSNVTYLSQPFYISSPNRPNTTCTEVCFGIGPNAPCYNNAGSAFRTPLAASIVIACALTLRNMFVL